MIVTFLSENIYILHFNITLGENLLRLRLLRLVVDKDPLTEGGHTYL